MEIKGSLISGIYSAANLVRSITRTTRLLTVFYGISQERNEYDKPCKTLNYKMDIVSDT